MVACTIILIQNHPLSRRSLAESKFLCVRRCGMCVWTSTFSVQILMYFFTDRVRLARLLRWSIGVVCGERTREWQRSTRGFARNIYAVCQTYVRPAVERNDDVRNPEPFHENGIFTTFQFFCHLRSQYHYR